MGTPKFVEAFQRKDITYYQISRDTGISLGEAERLWKGQIDPRLSTIIVLIDYATRFGLGCPLEDFLGDPGRARVDRLLRDMEAKLRAS